VGRREGQKAVQVGRATLRLSGLVPRATESDVRGYFEKYGEVLAVAVFHHADGSPGHGYVEFATEAEAENACVMTNGTKLRNRKIQVGRPRGRKED
jgi:RNA recognition motif-containing protein